MVVARLHAWFFLPPQCNICATPVVLPILHREDKKNARRQFLGMLFQIQVNHPILPIQSLFQDLNKIFNTNIVIRSYLKKKIGGLFITNDMIYIWLLFASANYRSFKFNIMQGIVYLATQPILNNYHQVWVENSGEWLWAGPSSSFYWTQVQS